MSIARCMKAGILGIVKDNSTRCGRRLVILSHPDAQRIIGRKIDPPTVVKQTEKPVRDTHADEQKRRWWDDYYARQGMRVGCPVVGRVVEC